MELRGSGSFLHSSPGTLLNTLKLTVGSFFCEVQVNEVLVVPFRYSLDFGRAIKTDGERHQKNVTYWPREAAEC